MAKNTKTCSNSEFIRAAAGLLSVNERTIRRWEKGQSTPAGWPGVGDFRTLQAWAIESGRVKPLRVLEQSAEVVQLHESCPLSITDREQAYYDWLCHTGREVGYFNPADDLERRECARECALIEVLRFEESEQQQAEKCAYEKAEDSPAIIGRNPAFDFWKMCETRLKGTRTELKRSLERRDALINRLMLTPYQRKKGDTAGRKKKGQEQGSHNPLSDLKTQLGGSRI